MDVVSCPTDGESACCRAGVVALTGNGHGACACTAVVTPREGVVGILDERSLTIDNGRFRLWPMTGVAHPVVASRYGDRCIAVGHRRVGHIIDYDNAEGLVRRDGDGERVLVAAHRGGTTRDVGAALGLDRGAIEPQGAGLDGHRERTTGDYVGERGPFLEVERAVEDHVGSPMDHSSVTEGVA